MKKPKMLQNNPSASYDMPPIRGEDIELPLNWYTRDSTSILVLRDGALDEDDYKKYVIRCLYIAYRFVRLKINFKTDGKANIIGYDENIGPVPGEAEDNPDFAEWLKEQSWLIWILVERGVIPKNIHEWMPYRSQLFKELREKGVNI